MVREEAFKKALDMAWYGFSASAALIDRLEGTGLSVSKVITALGDFGSLYGIQEHMVKGVMQLLGIDLQAGGSVEGWFLREDLAIFLHDTRTEYPESEAFPMERYEGLLGVIRKAGIEIPWERRQA